VREVGKKARSSINISILSAFGPGCPNILRYSKAETLSQTFLLKVKNNFFKILKIHYTEEFKKF
jgi:hypothetical protein